MRNEHVRIQTVELSPSGKWAVFTISFRYPDRAKAQGVTRELVARLITAMGAPPSDTAVLDSASLPETPSYPNRLSIATLGTVAGILLGLGASRFRLAKPATA